MTIEIVEPGRPRVLAIGGRTEVLEAVTSELASCGYATTGVTIETALEGVAGQFDIISFGAGVSADVRHRLEEQLRRRSPHARFVRTYAPYAAFQIVAAARNPNPLSLVDLDAYCKRIGYAGPLDPTIGTLTALQERHLASIPFEAIDVLLGRGIDISPAAVDAKLIGARRGGYCYEQNGLFKRVLSAIGFEVTGLVASVRWMAEPGAPPPPRTHMALRVEIDGVPWLADVGFGASVPPAPLRLDRNDEQPTLHETFRFIPFGPGLLLQARVRGQWQPLYDLSPEPVLDSHYELFNWFTSTHPTSSFRQRLIAARTTPDARYSLLDNRLTIRWAEGSIERRYLGAEDIALSLEDALGLEVQEDWRPLFQRAAVIG